MTLGELEQMPERELARWRLYYFWEPFGTLRDNMHAGIIASAVIASVAGNDAPPPSRFMLEPAAAKPQSSPGGLKVLSNLIRLADRQHKAGL